MNRKRQHGVAMVEFSLIAIMFFMLIFGAIEFARAWFVFNTLTEMTRIGARIAAVCPADIITGRVRVVNAMLYNPDLTDVTTTSGLLGLTPNSINIDYLADDATTVLARPTNDADGEQYDRIKFVRVRLDSPDQDTPFGFQLFIPMFAPYITSPTFSTTLPRESLGRIDATNPVTERDC